MAYHPDVGMGIELGDVGVQIHGGSIISVFPPQRLHETGLVAGVSARIAVADLSPEVLATLSAAAAEKEVVV